MQKAGTSLGMPYCFKTGGRMSGIIRKEHNVSTLKYHIVCPAKYRRAIISEYVDKKLREICLGIEARYEIKFLEIGTERGHARFLVQSVPAYSPERLYGQ
jgi:REP element-mobilizing transposase RayT